MKLKAASNHDYRELLYLHSGKGGSTSFSNI